MIPQVGSSFIVSIKYQVCMFWCDGMVQKAHMNIYILGIVELVKVVRVKLSS